MEGLHILHLAAPYTAADSTSASPSALLDDLKHYQDLFTKLRFSYTEQVTKEKFLRAITSNPPEVVSATAIAEIEQDLKSQKADLKIKKEEVRELIRILEEQSRQLARRYQHLQLRRTQLDSLPEEIDGLQQRIEGLRARLPSSPSSNPDLNLNLLATKNLLQQREGDLAAVRAQITLLKEQRLPYLTQQTTGLEEDLAPLQVRKQEAVQAAKDAQAKRKAGGGAGDELDEQGRWLRAVELGLKRMVQV